MGFSMEKLSFVVKKNINCLVLTLYLQDIALHMLCHKKKGGKKEEKKRRVQYQISNTHTRVTKLGREGNLKICQGFRHTLFLQKYFKKVNNHFEC